MTKNRAGFATASSAAASDCALTDAYERKTLPPGQRWLDEKPYAICMPLLPHMLLLYEHYLRSIFALSSPAAIGKLFTTNILP